VRLGDLLEALLRRLVARIHVRVVLARKPAISLLDLLRLRVPLDPQGLVEVFFRHLKAVSIQQSAVSFQRPKKVFG
jgi:hypothetical protein